MLSAKKGVVPKNVILRTVDGATFKGKVNLGMEERVSDLFTKVQHPFLIIFDMKTGGVSGRCKFINKQHIIWAEEEDDSPPAP